MYVRTEKICYNCGFTTMIKIKDTVCPVCNNELQTVGFFLGRKLSNMNTEQERKWIENEIGHEIPEHLREQLKAYYAKKLEEIEEKEKEYRHRQLLEQQQKNIARMQKEADKKNCIPQCPICRSTNIKKITLTKRAVKTAAFGAFGAVDDMGKTYQCNNCGSKF